MPKILVKEYYQGRLTGERKIVPGEYEWGDALLFGLEELLIEKRIAVRVDDPLPLVTPENSVYVRTEDGEPTIVYFDPATVNFFAVEPGTDESTFIDTYGVTDPKYAHETVILPPEHKTVTHEEALKQFEVEREKVTKRVKRGK